MFLSTSLGKQKRSNLKWFCCYLSLFVVVVFLQTFLKTQIYCLAQKPFISDQWLFPYGLEYHMYGLKQVFSMFVTENQTVSVKRKHSLRHVPWKKTFKQINVLTQFLTSMRQLCHKRLTTTRPVTEIDTKINQCSGYLTSKTFPCDGTTAMFK